MLEYYKIRTKKIKLIEKYNIFKEIPIDKSEEKFFEFFKNDKKKIEKIVSNGQKSTVIHFAFEWICYFRV